MYFLHRATCAYKVLCAFPNSHLHFSLLHNTTLLTNRLAVNICFFKNRCLPPRNLLKNLKHTTTQISTTIQNIYNTQITTTSLNNQSLFL
mmetsp:Transcript_17761/g.35237  ORF Transcript_17761/g.35237 Transcript_17761/m.35237 type:complete len:90 (-) Transcript_17761:112-381(-)